LVAAQLLHAAGCRVVGLDLDESKLALLKGKGISTFRCSPGSDPVDYVHQVTENIGADGVIITASSKSDEIATQAARMSRKRGRIVLVGAVGLNLNRGDFYEKELSFQVSCSYGPGRYDEFYEQKGRDYPLPFVRWTEKRNFEAFLQSVEVGRLDLRPLITHQVPLENYRRIYDDIGRGDVVAAILEYSEDTRPELTVDMASERTLTSKKGVVGLIGAGNFAGRVILPELKKTGVDIKSISSSGGINGTRLAKKFGISHSTTDYRQILDDPEVDLVVIATRHDQHAPMVQAALSSGKHVFVEKPLAIFPTELEAIRASYRDHPGSTVTVGFNRRFSPHAIKVRELLDPIDAPLHVTATMNAGQVPPDAWIHDMEVGGGRIIGEACHLIDLITFFTGSMVTSVCMSAMGDQPKENTDNATILLSYANGSSGVVHYLSNGSRRYSKERIEVFAQGKTIIIDNFKLTRAFGVNNFNKLATRLDKGHRRQFELLADRLREGSEPLIPFDQLVNTTKATFAALASLKQRSWIDI
jgi:predicted dehydrogenase